MTAVQFIPYCSLCNCCFCCFQVVLQLFLSDWWFFSDLIISLHGKLCGLLLFVLSNNRRHTIFLNVTGVQTCARPIFQDERPSGNEEPLLNTDLPVLLRGLKQHDV